MHDLHSTHNPYGDEPTIMEDVKITMTYVPVIKAENIETNHDQKKKIETNNTHTTTITTRRKMSLRMAVSYTHLTLPTKA